MELHVNQAENDADSAAFAAVLDALPNKRDIVAIFGGHMHNWAGAGNFCLNNAGHDPVGEGAVACGCQSYGRMSENNPPRFLSLPSGLKIPAYFSGSAQYSKYLKVRFQGGNPPDVQVVDSSSGQVSVVGVRGDPAPGACPGSGDWIADIPGSRQPPPGTQSTNVVHLEMTAACSYSIQQGGAPIGSLGISGRDVLIQGIPFESGRASCNGTYFPGDPVNPTPRITASCSAAAPDPRTFSLTLTQKR